MGTRKHVVFIFLGFFSGYQSGGGLDATVDVPLLSPSSSFCQTPDDVSPIEPYQLCVSALREPSLGPVSIFGCLDEVPLTSGGGKRLLPYQFLQCTKCELLILPWGGCHIRSCVTYIVYQEGTAAVVFERASLCLTRSNS